jgi:nitrite reductase/ring-hydroxylating ferredoxin subunit
MWIKVAPLSELSPGDLRPADAGNVRVVLYNVGGTIYATDSRCAHQGGPLGDGLLSGSTVTCPWHAWQFDVCTGESDFDPAFRVRTFPTKIEADHVWVNVDHTPREPGKDAPD